MSVPRWAVGAYTYTPPPGGGVQMGSAAYKALVAADPVRVSFSSGPVKPVAQRVSPVQRRVATNYRRIGFGDVNEDAEKALRAAGYTGVDCKYEAYQGPLAGGHNVCDVAGDTGGYSYGAELLARPGGAAILATELANTSYLVAQREAEQVAIQARARELAAQEKAAAAKLPAAQSNAPTPAIVPAASGAPVIPNPAAPGSAQSLVAPAGNWFTESMFFGLPNWLLALGVAGGAYALGGSRR